MSDLTSNDRATKQKPKLFDSKCMDLALHFLPAEVDQQSEQARELAQAIQDCVEDYFLLVEQRNSHD